MLTLGSLITGDFESETDREMAPFALFLTFPVVVPLAAVYYTGLGTYKLGYAIKEHNPIKFYHDRQNSIKKLQEMAKNGINPFTEPEVIYYNKRNINNKNIIEEKQILLKTKEELEKYKQDSYKANEYINICPGKEVFYEEVYDDKFNIDYIPCEKTVVRHKTDYSKKPKQLTFKRK